MSSTLVPEPAAMRRLRLWLSRAGLSRSAGVMDWMMASVRARAFSSTWTFFMLPMPGIMASMSCMEPMPLSWTNWS